ncbi:hypothetical protein HAALTHF_13230n [Vreelandella aquamarina]|nr:hypothetical protein HAALTHF_13230n [Halomonas axialensis]
MAAQDVLDLSAEPSQRHDSYARRLGIETLAAHGMQGRGVLVDLVRAFGSGRTLIGYRDLLEALEQQSVVLEQGDMLVLRTGFAEALLDMKGTPQPDVLKTLGQYLMAVIRRYLSGLPRVVSRRSVLITTRWRTLIANWNLTVALNFRCISIAYSS